MSASILTTEAGRYIEYVREIYFRLNNAAVAPATDSRILIMLIFMNYQLLFGKYHSSGRYRLPITPHA